MTYKHLTFWSLVDRLDNYKRCHYPSAIQGHRGRMPIDPRQFHHGWVTASDLCPGLSVQYDYNLPVKIMLIWSYRNYSKQIGSIWMAKDGTTVVRYVVPTVTASELYSDKLIALHKWLRGGGKCPAKKYEAMLPTHLASHGTRTSVAVNLSDEGEVVGGSHSVGSEAIGFRRSECHYYAEHDTGWPRHAALNPMLRCWDWWTPGKRALGAAQALRRECSQFGRAWVRPFFAQPHGGKWCGGVAVVLPSGNATHMLIGEDSAIADIEKEKDRIASWAMNQIEIPGPMFC